MMDVQINTIYTMKYNVIELLKYPGTKHIPSPKHFWRWCSFSEMVGYDVSSEFPCGQQICIYMSIDILQYNIYHPLVHQALFSLNFVVSKSKLIEAENNPFSSMKTPLGTLICHTSVMSGGRGLLGDFLSPGTCRNIMKTSSHWCYTARPGPRWLDFLIFEGMNLLVQPRKRNPC